MSRRRNGCSGVARRQRTYRNPLGAALDAALISAPLTRSSRMERARSMGGAGHSRCLAVAAALTHVHGNPALVSPDDERMSRLHHHAKFGTGARRLGWIACDRD